MNRFGLSRRLAIHRGLAAVVASSSCAVARASVADWMPYRADQIVRIEPSLSDAGNGTAGMRRIEPQMSDFRPSVEAQQRLIAPLAARREHITLPPLREHLEEQDLGRKRRCRLKGSSCPALWRHRTFHEAVWRQSGQPLLYGHKRHVQ